MNTFIVGAIVVLALWVIVSIKSRKNAVGAFNAFDEAEPWMVRNNIVPGSVNFASYADKALVLNDGATILVGTGKNTSDQDIGFVIEVLPHQGCGRGRNPDSLRHSNMAQKCIDSSKNCGVLIA